MCIRIVLHARNMLRNRLGLRAFDVVKVIQVEVLSLELGWKLYLIYLKEFM